jgi:hypothetical protein
MEEHRPHHWFSKMTLLLLNVYDEVLCYVSSKSKTCKNRKARNTQTHKHGTNEGKVSLLLILNLILKEK